MSNKFVYNDKQFMVLAHYNALMIICVKLFKI